MKAKAADGENARAGSQDDKAPDEVEAVYLRIDEVPVERVEVWNVEAENGGAFAGENDRMTACERTLGYSFGDRRLLARALTHSSSTADKQQDNERMEFFGDAVLDLAVREYLFHNFPTRQEGDLTEAKSAIVCRASLVRAAKRLDLRRFLILGRGMGRRRGLPESLLADAYEAVVAAVYLDGGYRPACEFIMRTLGEAMPSAIEKANSANFKSSLQKIAQRRRNGLPVYRVLGTDGPEHSRVFEVAVLMDGRELGRGSGTSKKAAEQEAAKTALATLAALGDSTPEGG